jgi:hypothetical protein
MEKLMSIVVVLGVVAGVLLQCTAAETVHVVGDSTGWTIPQGGAQAYQTWAASKQFLVGDILSMISISFLSLLHLSFDFFIFYFSLSPPISSLLQRDINNSSLISLN